ncbi:MAG: hypothetical protein ABI306_09185 [Caulobacteraceae bacterium]
MTRGGGDLDLSGIWHGRFSFPRNFEPVSFAATLAESDTWLSGSTEEVGMRGEAAGKTIGATLQGRRHGSAVAFLKTYDALLRGYDAVRYDGAVNAEATEVVGRWTIPGNWSGAFLMIRASGITDAVARETEAVNSA